MTMDDIYNFMDGRDVSSSFSDKAHNSEYSFEEFIVVDKEAKRVQAEVDSKKAGTYILEVAIPVVKHFDEETGEEVIDSEAVPAVYYVYTTDLKLKNSVTSELDVSKFI